MPKPFAIITASAKMHCHKLLATIWVGREGAKGTNATNYKYLKTKQSGSRRQHRNSKDPWN